MRLATFVSLLVVPACSYRSAEYAALDREPSTLLAAPTSPSGLGLSVAQRTEQQVAAGVSIKYFSSFQGEQGPSIATSLRRKTSAGGWDHVRIDGHETEQADSAAKEAMAIDNKEVHRAERGSYNTRGYEGLKRCGFSWDDAAAKVSPGCVLNRDCHRPKKSYYTWPSNATYKCFDDLPDYGRSFAGECRSMNPRLFDNTYCDAVCGMSKYAWCDQKKCRCLKTSAAWDLSAPIQAHDDTLEPEDLPKRTEDLLTKVRKDWHDQPGGLPACRWKPGKGCSRGKGSSGLQGLAQYECVEGSHAGQCSSKNWAAGTTSDCEISCVHVSLLRPVPYYALWSPGSIAVPVEPRAREPRYQHDKEKVTIEARGIKLQERDVLMSSRCRSNSNHFVGVTWYSPSYEGKASRLVRSCERVGICCKALLLPADSLGKNTPEGSEAFRFQVIAMKPAFILSQLEATDLPVVFLDTDLEFHSFPDLFMDGSWPHSKAVDIALYNFWGNETRKETKDRPNIGSGVTFFNKTIKAKRILTVWAEAMAWPHNDRAPDDQVLDLLLQKGGWLTRATFGWLPTSYMRMMPAYYRGIVPVIDHDHGSAPGLEKHSTTKPELPPIEKMQLVAPDSAANQGRPMYLTPAEAAQEVIDDKTKFPPKNDVRR